MPPMHALHLLIMRAMTSSDLADRNGRQFSRSIHVYMRKFVSRLNDNDILSTVTSRVLLIAIAKVT